MARNPQNKKMQEEEEYGTEEYEGTEASGTVNPVGARNVGGNTGSGTPPALREEYEEEEGDVRPAFRSTTSVPSRGRSTPRMAPRGATTKRPGRAKTAKRATRARKTGPAGRARTRKGAKRGATRRNK